MKLSTRRFFRTVFTFILFLAACYLIYWSSPVQKILYPIPNREYVFRYAADYQLDPYLVAAVIRVESRFFHQAESGSGARGLMQIMPETACWAARKLGIEFHPEMLFDPQYNIRIGCWYLRELLDYFNGNLGVTLAAYNAGQGNVTKWLDKGNWDGSLENLDKIPFEETRNYVKRVLESYYRYQKVYGAKTSW